MKPETNLSFPGDGLIKEQVAGLRLVDAVVGGRGAAEGLEAVGGPRRRRRGRVGLVAGGAPAPVAAAARAGGHAARLLPGSAQALCRSTPSQRQRPVPGSRAPRRRQGGGGSRDSRLLKAPAAHSATCNSSGRPLYSSYTFQKVA